MLGIKKTIDRMKSEGKTVPQWVLDMLKSGREKFYQVDNGIKSYWCPIEKSALKTIQRFSIYQSTRLGTIPLKETLVLVLMIWEMAY